MEGLTVRWPVLHGPSFRFVRLAGTLGFLLILISASDLTGQEPPSIGLKPADAVSEATFTRVRAVRELSDGRVILADPGEDRVRILNPALTEATDLGRRGRGPGEYSQPGRLYPLEDDRTLVVDLSSRRWLFLESDRFVETWSAQRATDGTHEMALRAVDHANRLLGLLTHRPGEVQSLAVPLPPVPDFADSVVVVRLDDWRADSPGSMDTIAVLAGPGVRRFCFSVSSPDARGTGPIGGCSPVAGEDRFISFSDGWLAVVRHEPYQVDWRAPDGGWIVGRPVDEEPRPMDVPAERCAAVRGYPFRGVERECSRDEGEGRDWPQYVPPFIDALPGMAAPRTPPLFAAPDGRLLVRRTPLPADRQTRYDVFARDGRREAVLTMPSNEAVVGVGRASVFVIETDGVDLQRLRRHPWP